ncbi:MAG: F510_1955 family glycosylhydrolase [Thermoleophilia bacterium]
MSTRRALVAAALGLALALAGCAGGEGPSADAYADLGPEHMHGLGVNPADDALYIATHTGLFRMPRGSDDSERVGDRLQDTMGFAVAGPDRFLGSGHPDLRDDLPPLLGLIESSDAGRSWTPVSLLGEADFHALRVSGSRVVGYDASGARVMASDDEGRQWRTLGNPGELVDLALDPDDPSRIVATGATGVVTTEDDGATWTRLPGDVDLLAWPAADALYGFSFDGEVAVSGDRGASWERVGDLGGEPAAATATGPDTLIVALHDGRIVSSGDGGASWAEGAW